MFDFVLIRSVVFHSSLVKGYCVPFPGSDRSVVNRTQRYNYNVRKERPVRVHNYLISLFIHSEQARWKYCKVEIFWNFTTFIMTQNFNVSVVNVIKNVNKISFEISNYSDTKFYLVKLNWFTVSVHECPFW